MPYNKNVFNAIKGDGNYDGIIDVRDLVNVKKTIAATKYQKNADLNDDGLLNASDLSILKEYLLDDRTSL